jgi:hypothetical protein
MSIETAGAQWKRYFLDSAVWPPGAWCDDEVIHVDGVPSSGELDLSAVKDSARILLEGGDVYHYDPSSGQHKRVACLESHFTEWLERQGTVPFAVEVPKEKLAAVQAAIAAILAS